MVRDSYAAEIDRYISKEQIRHFSEMNVWRGALQILFEWGAIFCAIYFSVLLGNVLIYLASVAWIGARQNALAVLMHEAVHYRLFKNKKLNDFIGEVFLAWPVGITLHGFRQTHFAHHRHVNDKNDPDWQRKQNKLFKYPKPIKEIIFISIKYLCGWYALYELVGVNKEAKVPKKILVVRLMLYAVLLASSIIWQFWAEVLLYWIVPLLTYFLWITYVRGVAEHFGGIEKETILLKKTRHVEVNLFSRLMLAPNNINYHIAHHLYPSVPFYNLPKLQATLMQNERYAKDAHITKGYWGLLKELISSKKTDDLKSMKKNFKPAMQ